jgi:toxin FitB
MSYLLDTSVVSELRKRSPDRNMLNWFDTASSAELFISMLTVGEISLGIERLRRKDEVQAVRLEQWLAGLRDVYADRLVSVDEQTAQEWGRINVPDQLPLIDGQKVRGWILVTRNTDDLARSGVALINPFTV